MKLKNILIVVKESEAFAEKLDRLYPATEYVNRLMTHSRGSG